MARAIAQEVQVEVRPEERRRMAGARAVGEGALRCEEAPDLVLRTLLRLGHEATLMTELPPVARLDSALEAKSKAARSKQAKNAQASKKKTSTRKTRTNGKSAARGR